ncbi:MAG: hypothetical protein QY322_00375 [bacterium]|nr:MAG: hypothetical protein QY322_00375 [bacterium]
MFECYIASQNDLLAIENALKTLWNPKLNYIFKCKDRIKNIPVISFDSRYLYVWLRTNNKYKLSKFLHNIKKIDDLSHKVWMSGIYIEEFKNILKQKTGKNINGPCGGLLTPFTKIHNEYSKTLNDPYHTKESYYATILHEFGHVYSDRLDKYGELFASCSEYSASKIFWPNHKQNLDKFFINLNKSLFKNNDQHYFAIINTTKIITKYPNNWPDYLLTTNPS